MSKPSVLFVCLGNICRSPLAEGLFRAELARRDLDDAVVVDSCGTGGWHVGERPDPRSVDVARRNGVDISRQRARQLATDDFRQFRWLVAMDTSNESTLRQRSPAGAPARIVRLTEFVPGSAPDDVPDPYYGGPRGFDDVFSLVQRGVGPLLDAVLADARDR